MSEITRELIARINRRIDQAQHHHLSNATLEDFQELRSASRLALLPEDIVQYILLGYLCVRNNDCYTLFGRKHSPQRIEAGRVITEPADKDYYCHGALHSYNDMPARTYTQMLPEHPKAPYCTRDIPTLVQVWYKHNLRHREGGPAYVTPYEQCWYQNDKLHRDDGPAIIGPYKEEWWLHGERHRDGGPAIVCTRPGTVMKQAASIPPTPSFRVHNAYEQWFHHGKCHRDDGPAFVSPDKYEWYQYGTLIKSISVVHHELEQL